jgi:hypothetical protein
VSGEHPGYPDQEPVAFNSTIENTVGVFLSKISTGALSRFRDFRYGWSSVCSCGCLPSLAKRASSLAVSVTATPFLDPPS